MPDALEAVKVLVRNYRKWAADNTEEKPAIAARQAEWADSLDLLIAEILEARARLRSVTNSLGDLSDLPDAVLAELSVTKIDDLEQQMRDIIASGEGEVGLDVVIVELYRRHKTIHPRRFVMNKLYRMAQKGLIQSVDGKKGVYTTGYKRKPTSAFDSDLDDDVPF